MEKTLNFFFLKIIENDSGFGNTVGPAFRSAACSEVIMGEMEEIAEAVFHVAG